MATPDTTNLAMTASSGVAPFHVLIDCSLVTCAGYTEPFQRLVYAIDWDDSMSSVGTARGLQWSYSPIAAHVYASAGTYYVRIFIFDPATRDFAIERATITVGAFGGTTYYFANGPLGNDANNGLDVDHPKETLGAMIALAAKNVRLLLARDDSWTAAVGGNDWGTLSGGNAPTEAQPFIIGSWGSGSAPPIIQANAAATGGLMRMQGIPCHKLVDIFLDGNGGAGTGALPLYQPGTRSIVHACSLEEGEYSISSSGASDSRDDWCISASEFYDSDEYHIYTDGTGGHVNAVKRIAILGCSFDTTARLVTGSPHDCVRGFVQRSVIASCTFAKWATNGDSSATGLKLNGVTSATEADKARYNAVTDNDFDPSSAKGPGLWIGPQANAGYDDEEAYDFVVERNKFGVVADNDADHIELRGGGGRIMIRANAFIEGRYPVKLTSRTTDSPHANVYIYNNSGYSTSGDGPRSWFKYDDAEPYAPVTDLECVGNIWHAPNEAAGDIPNYDESAGKMSHASLTVSKGNCYFNGVAPTNIWAVSEGNMTLAAMQALSKETGTITADPLYTNAAAGDLSLQAASPCLNCSQLTDLVGVDFNGYERPVGAYMDMGAFERGGVAFTPTAAGAVSAVGGGVAGAGGVLG